MGNNKDKYIYEVIRIINGKPLFLEEHYERLAASLELAGFGGIISEAEFNAGMGAFIDREAIVNDNVKFKMFIGSEPVETEYEFIKGHYPTTQEYAEGVDTQLLAAMRDNPHAKVHNQQLRELANQIIAENNLWEVILVDDEGFVTEGSRSNIFFIKGNEVWTSPADGVLLGVTRQKSIAVCQEHGIQVVEAPIAAEQIGSFDAAFVSGTSPKVLPIARIDDVQMDVNQETLRQVMRIFDQAIDKYLMGL